MLFGEGRGGVIFVIVGGGSLAYERDEGRWVDILSGNEVVAVRSEVRRSLVDGGAEGGWSCEGRSQY